MAKAKEKIIPHVLGEEQRSFLGARGAEMKTLAAERPEELVFAFRIGALDTSDTLSIVTACNKVIDNLRDAIQTKASVDGSVLLLIILGELLEVLLENGLNHVRSVLAIRRALIRTEVQRELCLHMKI